MPIDLSELESLADRMDATGLAMLSPLVRAAAVEIREHREAPDYRMILLQLMASLTLADHMGDAADDVDTALERLGLKVAWDDWPELARALHRMGVTTLCGTEIGGDDDEDGKGDEPEEPKR